jgi:hypothetical protein
MHYQYLYIPYTVRAWKDGVCLFEADCDLRIDWDLPDGRKGPVDWDVTEFHFDGPKPGENKARIYTKINRHEPLFHVLYKDLDREFIDARVCEALADDERIDWYALAAND